MLPPTLRAYLWPAERVLLGLKVSKWLRAELMSYSEEFELHVKVSEQKYNTKVIYKDLMRFDKCGGGVFVLMPDLSFQVPLYFRAELEAALLKAIPAGLSKTLVSSASARCAVPRPDPGTRYRSGWMCVAVALAWGKPRNSRVQWAYAPCSKT